MIVQNATLFLMIAVLTTCIPVLAQWAKPTPPASTPLAVETQLYLYNVDAEKFFTGANEWGTRASLSATVGHCVTLQKVSGEDNAYHIMNAADPTGTFLPLYIIRC